MISTTLFASRTLVFSVYGTQLRSRSTRLQRHWVHLTSQLLHFHACALCMRVARAFRVHPTHRRGGFAADSSLRRAGGSCTTVPEFAGHVTRIVMTSSRGCVCSDHSLSMSACGKRPLTVRTELQSQIGVLIRPPLVTVHSPKAAIRTLSSTCPLACRAAIQALAAMTASEIFPPTRVALLPSPWSRGAPKAVRDAHPFRRPHAAFITSTFPGLESWFE